MVIGDFLSCSGISALLSPFGYEGMIKGSIESTELGATRSNITRSGAFPIYVDAMVFAGIGKLSNDGETRIPQNDTSITEYGYAAPAFTPIQTPHLDLYADRQDDFVILQGNTQSIYFNGTNALGQVVDTNGNVIDGPDLQRLADIAPDFEDQGLLASLSKADLKKTDIYLYRVSNG